MPALDTPEVIEAMTWYVDLARVHGLMPAQSVIPQADIRDGRMRMTWQEDWLKSRRVAMWPDSISSYWYYFDSPWLDFEIGDIGIVPLPFGEQGTAYHLPWGYIMSAGTSSPKESWLWIKYLSRQQVPNGLHILPARRSVAQDADYWAHWQEEEQEIIEHSLSHLIKTHPESLVATELLKAVEAVFEGKTVEEALEAAQANALATYTVLAEMEPVEVLVTSDDTEDNDALIVEFASRNYDPTHSFREVAEVFNAEHSTVQVKITEAGARPDCFADSIALLNDAEGAMPRNLQPYVDVESSSLHDQFYFIDAFRRAGNLYGLPSLAQPQVLFYDQSLFDTAGLSYPHTNWTSHDFQSAARSLTNNVDGTAQYGFLPLSDAMVDLPFFMAMHNVELWDSRGHPRFDAPDVVEAINWYRTLIQESMPPYASALGETVGEQRRNLINNGQSGMWSVYLVPSLASNMMPKATNMIRMAPFPGNKVRLNYEGLFISEEISAEKAKACWQWITYAARNRSVTPGMGIPAFKETLASEAFTAQAGPSVVETYRELVQYEPLEVPNSLGTQMQLEVLREALAMILQGTLPESALSEAQRKASR